jgi:crotonobetainyl-CoA:carnitine CoA-transferase CaiB-like acyl-CoA transferase
MTGPASELPTKTSDGRPLPLAGIRVVDFTWIVAGPQATRILADLGADVIRVENEAHLDSLRLGGPGNPKETGFNGSGLFNNMNRNKRGMTLNLYHPGGREVAERLIATADVVAENFSPGAFERMGFGWERLQELSPEVVYLSLSGFGHLGRDASFVTWGPTAQAISGLTYLSGLPDQPPAGWGYSYLDHSAGYYGAIAVLLALRRRAREGGAQRVDLSQAETGMVMAGAQMLDSQVNGRPTERYGNRLRYPELAPHGAYRCAGDDRWIAIAVEADAHWGALCEVLGADALASDGRFATNGGRVAAQDELDASLEALTRGWDARELMYALQARGVPAGVAQTTEDKMEHDPQLAARGFYPRTGHAVLGDHRYEGLPFRLARLGWELRRGSPLFGEHSDQVLADLGCTAEEIAALHEELAV